MDVSAFSSLSDYDSFLDERFGLLSVSQESGINQAFSAYLSENVSVLGNSITLNASKGTGKYPLSNTSVLKQQILEYSEITVASEMLIEGFDIDKVLDQLTESLDLEDVQKEMDAVNATIDVAAEVENLLEAIVDTKSEYENKYVPALSEYRDAYSTFAAKAQNLADTLSDAEESLDEEEDSDSVYDDSDVKKAVKELKEARDTYQTKASEVKTSLSDLRGHIDKIFSATAALPEKLKAYDDKTSNGSAVDKCTTSSYEWLLIIIGTITETIDTLIGDDYRNKMNQEGLSLEEQIIKQDECGVSFYSQSKVALDMLELNTDDVLRLISELKLTGSYDYIVIDMDFTMNREAFKVYKQSHAVVWVGDGTELSNIKIQRAFNALSIMEQNAEAALSNRLCLVYNKFSNKTSKTVGDIGLRNIGGAPRYEHASTKQVVEQLSLMNMFENIIITSQNDIQVL